MDEDVKTFFEGATWFVVLFLIIMIGISGIVWMNRYMTFDHIHNHSHPPHKHDYPHEPHTHILKPN